jgi:uncharacterized membrane protein HdeD (DUF308 family)
MMATMEALTHGALVALLLVAAVFFCRFWRESRDFLFLAFGASFAVKAANEVAIAVLQKPNEGTLWNYIVGLASTLLIVVAIVHKNFKS